MLEPGCRFPAGERRKTIWDQYGSCARLVWANIETQLKAADITLDNLVKVSTFLSDRTYNLDNRTIRNEVLGDRKPALTVIIAGICDSKWLLEIEAVAAA